MEQVLHLYVTTACGHDCPLCCNKHYKLDEIPVVTVELLKTVETVCITGGDPFAVQPDTLIDFINKLRGQYKNIKNLYVYTSGNLLYKAIDYFIDYDGELECEINGINVAPKDIWDWIGFTKVLREHPTLFRKMQSSRLYVFKEQRAIFDSLGINIPSNVEVIDRQWTSTFETPDNEHFARLPILL